LSLVNIITLVLSTSLSMNKDMDRLQKVNKVISASSRIQVHWFRHGDLRLHDNPALCRCITKAKKNDENIGILPIFCFDPRIFGNEAKSSFNSLKCGPRRAQFILESVKDLRLNLEKRGSGLLVVANGKAEEIFEKIKECEKDRFLDITCQEEVGSEEKLIDARIQSLSGTDNKLKLEKVWGSTLYNHEVLPFKNGVHDMPDTFTPFRNKVEKNCEIDTPLSTPSSSDLKLLPSSELQSIVECLFNYTNNQSALSFEPSLLDLGYTNEDLNSIEKSEVTSKGVMNFVGGETAALARVKDYIWDKDLLKTYFDTRNGMLGADYSTKFSPWLAHGCLSPRYVAQQCREYEKQRVENKSTYWVVFELLWRDFFKFFAMKHGNSIFLLDGTLGQAAHGSHPNSRKWGLDKRHLQLWKDGKTGYPLVDANMRELKATGFMSNRGRQNVCSFLAIDMKTDWRYGADYFEQELLDYDVYSNWGNWCSGAGMTGGRLNRFNIVKQGKDYDCDGDYVKYWCPELKKLPNSRVHEPWKMTDEEQGIYDCKLDRDYPRPFVQPSAFRPRNDGRSNKGSGKKKGGYNRKEMKSLKQGNYRIK